MSAVVEGAMTFLDATGSDMAVVDATCDVSMDDTVCGIEEERGHGLTAGKANLRIWREGVGAQTVVLRAYAMDMVQEEVVLALVLALASCLVMALAKPRVDMALVVLLNAVAAVFTMSLWTL